MAFLCSLLLSVGVPFAILVTASAMVSGTNPDAVPALGVTSVLVGIPIFVIANLHTAGRVLCGSVLCEGPLRSGTAVVREPSADDWPLVSLDFEGARPMRWGYPERGVDAPPPARPPWGDAPPGRLVRHGHDLRSGGSPRERGSAAAPT
jgi:hypothetical protein